VSRCEDYPCCGHEAGGCPDPDGRFKCARCGGPLPRRATSAVCARCHADWRRKWPEGDDDLADREDGDLALREGPAAAPPRPSQPHEVGGARVETWGGGRYGTVAWYRTVEAAEEYAGWLARCGFWRGMPPRVVVDDRRCGV
jgi:hypothetical protein